MERVHKPGNVRCTEVREMRRDLIDARRGEIPHADGTRLSACGMRPTIELHLPGCAGCRDELAILEDVGAAYSEFSVGELPTQAFSDFGAKVRARMANGGAASAGSVVRIPQSTWLRRASRFALTTVGVAAVF